MGLPALPGTRNTLDDLAPLRQTVVNLARQASEVARVDVTAHETRLAMKADALTRGAYYRTSADLLTQALHVAIDAAYEAVDGVIVGCEPSGRVNVALPWSTRSHALYALRRSQADVLRAIVTGWQIEHAAGRYNRAPVFVRCDAGKWYVNLDAYPDAQTAHRAIGAWLSPSYVRQVEIQLRESAHQTSTNAAQGPQRKRSGLQRTPV